MAAHIFLSRSWMLGCFSSGRRSTRDAATPRGVCRASSGSSHRAGGMGTLPCCAKGSRPPARWCTTTLPVQTDLLSPIFFPELSADCGSSNRAPPPAMPVIVFSHMSAFLMALLFSCSVCPRISVFYKAFLLSLYIVGGGLKKKKKQQKQFPFFCDFEAPLLLFSFSRSDAPYYLLQCKQREPFKIFFPPPPRRKRNHLVLQQY